MHSLLWTENASVIDKNADEEVLDFFRKVCSRQGSR